MKYPCEMINDLLPLYYDDACSEETKKIVETHLSECDSCKNMMKKIGDTTYNDCLLEERERIIGNYTKNIKRKVLLISGGILSIILLVCLIVNIATSNTLDWFFIVVTSLMVFASFTAVPLIVDNRKRLWTLGSFVASLVLLLLICCLYNNGNWFWVASISVCFGLSVVFLPFTIGQLPLKGFALHNKEMLVMAIDTILLYAVIITCGLYTNPANYWKNALLITTTCVIFVWVIFTVIRYFKVNGFTKTGICFISGGLFISLIHDIISWIMEGALHISFMDANLFVWNNDVTINANTYLLLLLLGCILGIIFLAAGLLITKKSSQISSGL